MTRASSKFGRDYLDELLITGKTAWRSGPEEKILKSDVTVANLERTLTYHSTNFFRDLPSYPLHLAELLSRSSEAALDRLEVF